MKWSWTKTKPDTSVPRLGFTEGDVVYHKISGVKAVITGFCWYDSDEWADCPPIPSARCEAGTLTSDEFLVPLCALTKTQPAALDAQKGQEKS